VVYNGDINDLGTFQYLESRFPSSSGWMLGRGLIANPFLPEMIQSGTRLVGQRNTRFEKFHDDLVVGYCRQFSGPGHVLDRMKGFWRYFAAAFPDGRRIVKQIRKADSLDSYRQAVKMVFDVQDRLD